MQLHLEGSEDLNLHRERVFQLLTDPNFIAKSIPDAQEAKVLGDGTVEAKMKLGISLVTAVVNVKMNVSEKVPTQRARLTTQGSGSGSNIKIVSDFNLEGDMPTKMKWVADADITGVMAGIGSTIMKGFAQKKVKEIFDGLRQAMEKASA
jgi:uncharacterized protein